MAVGAFLNNAGMGVTNFNGAKSQWELLTGRALTVTRKYKAASIFGYSTDSDLLQMIAAGVKICLTLRPAFNPVSATDLTNMESLLSQMKAAGAVADITLWHEPYYSGLTAAQYTAMINYYGPTVRQYYPLVFVPSASAPDSTLAGGFYPGDGSIDKIAFDCYAYSYLTGGTRFDNIAAIADAATPLKSLGIWEFNGSADPVNGQTQANVTTYFDYIRTFFTNRLVAGKPNGDLLLFNSGNANWLGTNSNQQCGFEGGTGSWVASGGCTIGSSSVWAHSYGGSMSMTATGTTNMSARPWLQANYSQGLPVTPGQIVSAFAWFRAGTVARNCQATIEFYNSTGTLLSTAGGLPAANSVTADTQVSNNNNTVPANAAYAFPRPQINAPAGAGEVHYVDDVAIFIDGPSPNQVNCINFSWDYRLGLYDTLYDAFPTSGVAGGINLVAVYDPIGGTTDADVIASGTGTSGSAASGTLAQPDEHVIAFGWDNAGGTPSWTTGSSLVAPVSGHSTGYLTAAYLDVTARTSVTPAFAWPASTNWAIAVVSLTEGFADAGAATDALQVITGTPVALADTGAATEFLTAFGITLADSGAGTDALSWVLGVGIAVSDQAAASDALQVQRVPVSPPVPSARTGLIASPAFVRSRVPRMHLQNLVTGAWMHRDVQGITSPQITWMLNGADSFTCQLSPPRAELMDASGNPVLRLWQTACYLEESDEIKFGGILTASQSQGPVLNPTFTGFAGYPNGMPYEGPHYQVTRTDALDVVRYIWKWLQDQPGGDLQMDLGTDKAGVLVGAQVPPGAFSTLKGDYLVSQDKSKSQSVIQCHSGGGTSFSAFQSGQNITVGGEATKIKSVSGQFLTVAPKLTDYHRDGAPVVQVVPPTPFVLDWWNSTDCGQEITSIQQEAVFDYRERHTWTDRARTGVRHQLLFAVPRAGTRRSDLRFAETENIIAASQLTQDGSRFANNVIGIGNGQGSATIRSSAAVTDGRLRRSYVYADQTVTSQARMAVKAQRVLTSMKAVDTPATITINNHRNAPFGSFGPGDDIPVRLADGWRNTLIWCRIIQMTQDPTTNQMTLTLARSDSFTYIAQTGQAGTL